MDNIDVGSRVRDRRKAKGLTQEEFGQQLNVSKSQVSMYERGETPMTTEQILRAAVILEAPASYFVGDMSVEQLIRQDEVKGLRGHALRIAEDHNEREKFKSRICAILDHIPFDLFDVAERIVAAMAVPEYRNSSKY